MAAKKMMTGDSFKRIVGTPILEHLASSIIKKYGINAKDNIILSLKSYIGYNHNKLENSNPLKNLIQKLSNIYLLL